MREGEADSSLQRVQPWISQQVEYQGSSANAHRRKAVQMRGLW